MPLNLLDAKAAQKNGNPRGNASVAENAIIIRLFALAILSVATQKDPAFQASSPKTSAPPFGAAFFLRWPSGSLLFASPVDAIDTEDAMGGLWSILPVLWPVLLAVVVICAILRQRRETHPAAVARTDPDT